MKSKLVNLLKNVLLTACTFLLCFLVLELILRMAGYGNLIIYEPHPRLFWRIKPSQECYTKVGRKPVRINSHGTRGPEFEREKPPDTLRVLFLGDSKTFGWGLSENETYSVVLGNLLQNQFTNGKKVEVINAGVNAWSYPQMAIYFEEYGKKLAPDFVIIGDANLWTQFSETSSPEFVTDFMRRVRLKNFLRRFATFHFIVEVQLEAVYQKYRTRFIPVDPKTDTLFADQQRNDPNTLFAEAIRRLCQTALTNNIQPILTFVPSQNQIGQETNAIPAIKEKIARDLDIPFLDLTAKIAPQKDELYLPGDPVHLNEQGNTIMGEALLEVLLPLLNPN